MKGLLIAFGLGVLAAPAAAQEHHHHEAPAATGPAAPAASQPTTPQGAAPETGAASTDAPIPQTPPPPPPSDHAADQDYGAAAMAASREVLREEHGAVRYSKVMASLLEHQVRSGGDGYRWEGSVSTGGDFNRLLITSEGEGAYREGLETAEAQVLWSHAIDPFFDLHAGVRQDFKPRARTYAALGAEGLWPYWFDVQGAVFLSTKGELLARAEATYDLRLTQRLILQPRVELNVAAQDRRETRTGAGLSNAELGLRLRYEVTRTFAPYIGVSYDRRLGKTAAFARAAGEDPEAVSFVVGVRDWF